MQAVLKAKQILTEEVAHILREIASTPFSASASLQCQSCAANASLRMPSYGDTFYDLIRYVDNVNKHWKFHPQMDYESKVQIVENYSMLIISSIATSTTLHLQMRTHWAARYGSYKNRRHSHKLSPSKSLMKCSGNSHT